MRFKTSDLTFCLINLLTPSPDTCYRSADKVTAFYDSCMFIAVCTSARAWILSWTRVYLLHFCFWLFVR